MKTRLKRVIAYAVPALIIVIGLTVVLAKRNNNDKEFSVSKNHALPPHYRSYPIMGTWAEVTLYSQKKDIDSALDDIYDAFKKINNICNRFNKSSELSRLNSTAAEKPFKCSPLFWDILIKATYFYELSDGAFDVTITPLMKLWGFYQKQKKIPSKDEIKSCLKNIGLDKVIFDETKRTVFFKSKKLKIDLGGIAKGYAVDYAFDAIKKYDIESGVINLGGNIRFFPKPPPGKSFYSVGIRNPFQKSRLMSGTLHLLNQSLATSGDYERYIVLNGQRFTHIINPKTGYPVKDMASVTVISESALLCDALSTSVFINGNKFAESIHERFPDIQILIIKGYHDKADDVEINKIGKIWEAIELND